MRTKVNEYHTNVYILVKKMRFYEKYLGYEPLTATDAFLCYTLAGMYLVLYSVSATKSKML